MFEKQKLKLLIGNTIYNCLKEYNVYIAGGAITSLFTKSEINDIDIYFRSKEDLAAFVDNELRRKYIISSTNKAILFKHRSSNQEYQIITFKVFETPQDIFDTFDFTVCMGCYDFAIEDFVFHDDFMKHNAQRILKFNHGTAFPIISALRVNKYINKGYTISKPDFIKIILTCMNLNISSTEELSNQMGGMYGYNLDKILPKVDTFNLSDVITHIVDKDFSEEYFNMPIQNNGNINSEIFFDEKIMEIIGKENFKYYDINNKFYATYNDYLFVLENVPGNVKINTNILEFVKDNKMYKYVIIKDGKYYSSFDRSFEYKLHEEIIPLKNNRRDGRIYGFRDLPDIDKPYNINKALIEITFDPFDIINIEKYIRHEDFTIKKGIFTKVIRG